MADLRFYIGTSGPFFFDPDAPFGDSDLHSQSTVIEGENDSSDNRPFAPLRLDRRDEEAWMPLYPGDFATKRYVDAQTFEQGQSGLSLNNCVTYSDGPTPTYHFYPLPVGSDEWRMRPVVLWGGPTDIPNGVYKSKIHPSLLPPASGGTPNEAILTLVDPLCYEVGPPAVLTGTVYGPGDLTLRLKPGDEGFVLKTLSGVVSWAAESASGVSSFIDLTDTDPSGYVAEDVGKLVVVNSSYSGLEFAAFPLTASAVEPGIVAIDAGTVGSTTTIFALSDHNHDLGPHPLISEAYHTVSGLTAGHVLKALTATTYGFGALTVALGQIAPGTQWQTLRTNSGATAWEATSILTSSDAAVFVTSANSGNTFYVDRSNDNTLLRGKNSGATLGSTLVTNGAFTSDLSGWTVSGTGTGWVYDAGKATHTAGNTETLSQNVSVVNGTTYSISFNQTCTAGNFVITLGTDTVWNYGEYNYFNATSGYTSSVLFTGTTGTVALTVTPTSTFAGSIDNIVLQAVTAPAGYVMACLDSAGAHFFQVRGQYTSSVYNLGLGRDALAYRFASTNYNTAVGINALKFTTSGYNNTAVGYNALFSNTIGFSNVGVGYNALTALTRGAYNTALGYRPAYSLTSGIHNVFIGSATGGTITSGTHNVFIGSSAGQSAVGAIHSNIAIGFLALGYAGTGASEAYDGAMNVAIGRVSGYNNTTGRLNTYVGYQSGSGNQTGLYNVFVGSYAGSGAALQSHTGNVGLGYYVGVALSTGGYNTLLGYAAGDAITSGSYNIIIGAGIGAASATSDNQLNIGGAILGNVGAGVKSVEIVGALTADSTSHLVGAVTADSTAQIKGLLTLSDGTYGAGAYFANKQTAPTVSTTHLLQAYTDKLYWNGVELATAGGNYVANGAGTPIVFSQASAPSTPAADTVWIDRTAIAIKQYISSSWVSFSSATFLGLNDTPSTYTKYSLPMVKSDLSVLEWLAKGTDGQVLTMYSDGAGDYKPTWRAATSGIITFLGLSDTPAAYTGAGGYVLRVNAGVSAVEFVASANLTVAPIGVLEVTSGGTGAVLTATNVRVKPSTNGTTMILSSMGATATVDWRSAATLNLQAADAGLDSVAGLLWTEGNPFVRMSAADTFYLDLSEYQPLDTTLTALAALSGTPTGFITQTGVDTFVIDSTSYQPLDATLSGLALLSYSSGTPFVRMTAADTFALDITSYQPLDATLTALAALTGSTAGNVRRTGTDAFTIDTVSYVPATVQVIAGAGLTGGGALSGNVTLNVVSSTLNVTANSVDLAVVADFNNVTNYNNVKVDDYGRVTAVSNVAYLTSAPVTSVSEAASPVSPLIVTPTTGAVTISLGIGASVGCLLRTKVVSGTPETAWEDLDTCLGVGASPGFGVVYHPSTANDLNVLPKPGSSANYLLNSTDTILSWVLSSTYALSAITITAGDGLTGGGTLASNRTLAVGTASVSRIVVNADSIDLAQTGVAAGAYGNATTVPQITVDLYGRITTVSSVVISGTGTGTANTITKWLTTTTIGNSQITDTGSVITLPGNVLLSGVSPSLPLKVTVGRVITAAAIGLSTVEVTGTLPVARGGTNNSAWTGVADGNLVYYSTTGPTLVHLANGAALSLLTAAASGKPIWTTLDLVLGLSTLGYVKRTGPNTYAVDTDIGTNHPAVGFSGQNYLSFTAETQALVANQINLSGSHVTNTLPVGRGGTGAITLTSGGVLLGAGTSAVTATAAGAADQVLRIPGAGGAPAFGAIDLSKTAAVTGRLVLANLPRGATSYQVLTANGSSFDASWSTISTTNVVEGTNLYFTTARVDAEVYAWSKTHILEGAGIDLLFSDISSTVTVASTITGHNAVTNGVGNQNYVSIDSVSQILMVGQVSLSGTHVTGLLPYNRGGTGQSSWTKGNLLYASDDNTLAKLAPNTTTTKKYLSMTGTGSVGGTPTWDTVSVTPEWTSDVSPYVEVWTDFTKFQFSSNPTTMGTGSQWDYPKIYQTGGWMLFNQDYNGAWSEFLCQCPYVGKGTKLKEIVFIVNWNPSYNEFFKFAIRKMSSNFTSGSGGTFVVSNERDYDTSARYPGDGGSPALNQIASTHKYMLTYTFSTAAEFVSSGLRDIVVGVLAAGGDTTDNDPPGVCGVLWRFTKITYS